MPSKNPSRTPELVSAKEILERFHIPRASFYRLLHAGKIPSHREQKERWHTRTRLLFSPAEVEVALRKLGEDAPPLQNKPVVGER
jgi:hypothetical protein